MPKQQTKYDPQFKRDALRLVERGDRSLNAVLWILRTGAPWKSVHTRFTRWSKQGIWQGALREQTKGADQEGFLIEGTIVRVHQDAHGARKGGRSKSGVRAEVRRARSTRSSTPSEGRSASPSRRASATR